MTVQDAIELLKNNTCEYNLPFPMGVFGTLRTGQGNYPRMQAGKFNACCKAFLPNFIAHGLTISYKKGASAPFEVFFYPSQNEWDKMIRRVDPLEGFDANYAARNPNLRGCWYWRTLAWLHLLPENFKHNLFENVDLSELRNLKIKSEHWKDYETVPCWIYSNKISNDKAAAEDNYPIIWD